MLARQVSGVIRKLSALNVRKQFSSTKYDIFNPSPEHTALRNMCREFAEKEVDPQALEYNREEKFNLPLFRKLGELGLLGISVPEKYGGSNMDAVAVVIAMEEINAADSAFGLSYMAHSMLFVNNLARNGSEELKMRYLPDACSGKTIGGMCMSEPDAGTDVLGMKSFATYDKDKNHFVLNGRKMWITNGTIDGKSTGDVFLLYAKTDAKAKDGALTSFIVEKDMPGFQLGQKITDKLGSRASMTAELVFNDVKIPMHNVVGEVGKASICMMRNLEIERVAGAAIQLGAARRCIEIMSKYATERKAFGQAIANFGQIQQMIAESWAEYQAARTYLYTVANNLDLDSWGNTLASDGTKLFAMPIGKNICDRAIQVLGGNGYIGSYQVERLWRSTKLGEIGAGTLEAHHKNIIRDMRKLGGRLD